MSGSAQVRSVDSIDRFRQALIRFMERSTDAVETLEGQMRRAEEWIEHDRPAYWKMQLRAAQDAVNQAKIDLEKCLAFRVTEERPACREERTALKKAQQREEYCRSKIERIKQYARELNHEALEFSGRLGHLKRALETEMPLAEGVLQQILRRLEDYQIERAPQANREPPSAPTTIKRQTEG